MYADGKYLGQLELNENEEDVKSCFGVKNYKELGMRTIAASAPLGKITVAAASVNVEKSFDPKWIEECGYKITKVEKKRFEFGYVCKLVNIITNKVEFEDSGYEVYEYSIA